MPQALLLVSKAELAPIKNVADNAGKERSLMQEILKKLRKANGWTQKQLADRLHIKQVSVSAWECGRTKPDFDLQQKLADIYGVSIDELQGRRTVNYSDTVLIPVLGKVTAGYATQAIEDAVDEIAITRHMADMGTHIGLSVRGDSMEPQFFPGDTVIVRLQSDVDSGDIAVVFINGDEANVKKVIKTPNGIKLVSFNPDYPPFEYSNKEIEELPVKVYGKVVEVRRKI